MIDSSSISCGVCVILASSASIVMGQGEWILIDRDLREQRVELTQLHDGHITFVGEAGILREQSIHNLLAIIHKRPPKARPPREMPWISRQMELFGQRPLTHTETSETYFGTLELTDGQRWVGTLVSVHGDSLSWLLEDSIVLDVPLDQIRSAAILPPIDDMELTWSGLDDRVLLQNGDVLDGYIVEVGQHVRIDTPHGESLLPLDRVSGLLFANSSTLPSGIIVRTEAGSILTASSIDITATGRVSAEVGGTHPLKSLSLPATELRSLLIAPGAAANLAAIAPSVIVSSKLRSGTDLYCTLTDNSLGVDSLEFQGPVRVEWILPRPAIRFAATARLPPAMWAWGDCEVVIYTDDGSEVAREPLSADRPTAELNVPLHGLTNLTIEIISIRRGDVQDRVGLTRPMITWRSTEP